MELFLCRLNLTESFKCKPELRKCLPKVSPHLSILLCLFIYICIVVVLFLFLILIYFPINQIQLRERSQNNVGGIGD